MHRALTAPPRAVELAVLVAANLLVTVLRFLALRGWVFHPRRHRRPEPATAPALSLIPRRALRWADDHTDTRTRRERRARRGRRRGGHRHGLR